MSKLENLQRDLELGVSDAEPSSDWSSPDYADFLRRSEAEQALMRERIAEADKGVFISSEAMLRWIESWGTENELPPPEPDVFLPPRRS